MVELLAPAGSYDSLRAAVNAGADAVYIGGSRFGARAYADNPEQEALLAGIDYCHIHGKKLYMTVNTLLKEQELEEALYAYLLPYDQAGLDGVIVQDLGVLQFIREMFPQLPVHASTQMTVTGVDGARLLAEQGVTRVVTARELSLAEIRRIIEQTGIEVETFIHGALCYSYSGQCLFSSMIGGRSGNRGRCAQPCRLPYQTEDASGRALCGAKCMLSMKDLCTLEILPQLLEAGIASLKIEGRMKRPEYTAGVVSIYRRYIDDCLESGRKSSQVLPEDYRALLDLYNRGGFTEGYYYSHNGPDMMSMDRPNHFGTAAIRVQKGKNGRLRATALEPLHRGDVIESHSAPVSFTLGSDVREGATVPLPENAVRQKAGGTWYRTRNEALLTELKERYLDRNCKEKIKGELKISAGSPAILKVICDSHAVTVCSEQDISPAQSQPTTREAVEKQLRKTGNTPFEFETLDIRMEDGVFVAVRELNELRRRALAELETEILSGSRRGAGTSEPAACGQTRQSADAQAERSANDGMEQSADARTEQSANAQAERSANDRMEWSVDARTEQSADDQAERSANDGMEQSADNRTNQNQPAGEWQFSASVMTAEQLDAVLRLGDQRLSDVYLDLMLACEGRYRVNEDRLRELSGRVKKAGFRCFLNLPPVFRGEDRALFEKLRQTGLLDLFDGFLVHTLDELAYLRAYGPSGALLTADDTCYAYNSRAAEVLRELGIGRRALPAELNFKELKQLLEAERRSIACPQCQYELVVYGHQALMHSAQCVTNNTGGCTGRPRVLSLRDRKHAAFPVWNRCASCCNTIYNSVPLELADCREEIARLNPQTLRLSFTTETGDGTAEVLERYLRAFSDSRKQVAEEATHTGTRGHFKRGVE